jgi:hypothetical protein
MAPAKNMWVRRRDRADVLRAYLVCRAGFAARGMQLARSTKSHILAVFPRPKTKSWVGSNTGVRVMHGMNRPLPDDRH